MYYTRPSSSFGAGYVQGAVTLVPPRAFDPAMTYPLIISLHSYGGSGLDQQGRTNFTRADAFDDGCFAFYPTAYSHGSASVFWDYWNVGSGSDFDWIGNGLVKAAIAAIPQIDPKRVWVMGASNGGFMARQLVLQFPTLFTAGFTFVSAGGINDSSTQATASIPWCNFAGMQDDTVLANGEDPAFGGVGFPTSGHGGVGSTGYLSNTGSWNRCAARNNLTGTMVQYDTIQLMTTDGGVTNRSAYTNSTTENAVEYWQAPSMVHSFTTSANKGQIYFGWLAKNHRTR